MFVSSKLKHLFQSFIYSFKYFILQLYESSGNSIKYREKESIDYFPSLPLILDVAINSAKRN